MFLSLAMAYVLPFELFLFSYAVLGPLHYLTEIGWLHQRNYFISEHQNARLFLPVVVILGLLLVWSAYGMEWFPELSKGHLQGWGGNIILACLLLALTMVALPKGSIRNASLIGFSLILLLVQIERPTTEVRIEDQPVATVLEWRENPYLLVNGMQVERQNGALESDYGVLFKRSFEGLTPVQYVFVQAGFGLQPPPKCTVASAQGYIVPYGTSPGISFSGNLTQLALFIAVFLPTLVHVFFFTALFMAFGALKSKSRIGWISVALLLICGVLPFVWKPEVSDYTITAYVADSYKSSFYELNRQFLIWFGGLKNNPVEADAAVFTSALGIGLMRFIAFAYTYHYLNWFSKTSIIQWHKMNKKHLMLVIGIWALALLLYGISYKIGLQALFFLSFLHVFLEFPLNFASIKGLVLSLTRNQAKILK